MPIWIVTGILKCRQLSKIFVKVDTRCQQLYGYQLPVSWKETGHGNGGMDTVFTFHYRHSTEHGRLEMNGPAMMSTFSCSSIQTRQGIVTTLIGQGTELYD